MSLFFLYIHLNKSFLETTNDSFIKVTLNTFKGASNFFKTIANAHNVVYFNIKSQKNVTNFIKPFDVKLNNQILICKKYSVSSILKPSHNNLVLNIILHSLYIFNKKVYEFKKISFTNEIKSLTLT